MFVWLWILSVAWRAGLRWSTPGGGGNGWMMRRRGSSRRASRARLWCVRSPAATGSRRRIFLLAQGGPHSCARCRAVLNPGVDGRSADRRRRRRARSGSGDRDRAAGRSSGDDLGRRDGGAGAGDVAVVGAVIAVPGGVRVWIATGFTDMRRGMHGLALQVQQGGA